MNIKSHHTSFRLPKQGRRLFRSRSSYTRFEANYRITAHVFRNGVWVVRWNFNNAIRNQRYARASEETTNQ